MRGATGEATWTTRPAVRVLAMARASVPSAPTKSNAAETPTAAIARIFCPISGSRALMVCVAPDSRATFSLPSSRSTAMISAPDRRRRILTPNCPSAPHR